MFYRTILAILFSVTSLSAAADWEIAPESRVSFVSVKNGETTEVHQFTRVTGSLADDGAVMLNIDLASVDTGIAIRDQRMQEMLFETSQFSSAMIQAMLPSATMKAIENGEFQQAELSGSLSLHGERQRLTAPVNISPMAGNKVLVTTRQPIVLQAADFALLDGVNALRDIAGLDSISSQVPVTFSLILQPDDQ